MKRIARRVAALAVAVVGATTVTLAAAGPASASCGTGNTSGYYHCVWKDINYSGSMHYYGWNEDDNTYNDTHWNWPYWTANTIDYAVTGLNNMFAGCYNTYYTASFYNGDALGAAAGSNWTYVGNYWNDRFLSDYTACS
jgi:hypothetical protein